MKKFFVLFFVLAIGYMNENCSNCRYNCTDTFTRDSQAELDYWYGTSRYEQLSEEFIRNYQDKVNWTCISQYQILSEDFIREFADKVNWEEIFEHQKLSESFRQEFRDKMDLEEQSSK